MRLDLKISQKGLLLVAVPLIFELLFVTILASLHQSAEEAATKDSHSKNIVLTVNTLNMLTYETASAAFLFLSTKSGLAIDRFEKLSIRIPEELNELERLISNDPIELQYLQRMKLEASHTISLLQKMVSDIKQGTLLLHADQGRLLGDAISHSSRSFLQSGAQIVDLENRVLKSSPEEERMLRSLLRICLFAGVGINVLISVALAIFFSKSITSRVNRLVVNTRLLKDGKPLQPVLKQDDEIGHLDLVFHDMAAALDEALRKERAVTENVMDVILTMSSDYRITQINPAATHTWGYDLPEMLGQKLIEFIVQDDIDRLLRILGQLKSGEISTANVEARVACKHAEEKWMLWSIQWSASEKSFYCVAHDINEIKTLEQLKQDFVNMITHDLKTPLMSTQAFLDMLTNGAYGQLPQKGIATVRKTKGALKRMVDLLQQLLEAERIRTGRLDLELGKASIGSIVDSSVSMVESLAQEQKVGFIVEGDKDLVITADKVRLVQVIQNLLSNAIKFSPPNSKIIVSWQIAAPNMAEFQVSDQGPGIAEQYKDVIFDRFRQAAQPIDAQLKGTGLGLAICKAIIEQHHGSIGFFNLAGQGTTFWFRVPLSPQQMSG